MKPSFPSGSAEQYEALRQNAVARERIFSAAPLGAILANKPVDPTEGTRPGIVRSTAFSRSPASVDHG